ncbi:calcium activated cation channel [Lentinus tigrinus ALCF2SS1-7]|uniref:Calcium activated cation channel n=1 Tax=Lentinus tigrinus ALCF2SS1-6 TaxID=1328759 RepID=A0A5C2SSV2_9APHY|nr:calcium activated cation channel [Lentinus tigrinus ALCF2SS1-6]RPD80909.1 calcium activated cation channel [Lentinus tigrinus ALCF2SS1-7]
MPSAEDQISSLSVESLDPSPDTITSLVRRVRTMTLKLLPVEVPQDSISDPTGRVVTPQVINAYIAAAGDFREALPYCLLRARREFIWDANHNPADYEENWCRATACEVLARRVVHQAPPEKLQDIMSARFRHKEIDGDVSGRVSALEMAIDSHCTIFLSSSEAQDVVQDLWSGRTVQVYDDDGDVNFLPYNRIEKGGFWDRLDPSRMGVPRYQNIFRIIVWFLFLFSYSQAVREPLDKLDPDHGDLDVWEIIMYVLALAFSFEDLHKIWKLLVLVSWKTFGFWNVISTITDCLLTAAFVLRMAGMATTGDQGTNLRLRSFQCLSFAAPLLWIELIPIFDGFKFVGTMQICIARMLKESGFFFCLLALLGIGFLQGLYALDAADGQTDHPTKILNVLIQALLQSPNYEMFNATPLGMTLYYLWNVATAVILLNVLISLFSSAYEDVVEDAAAEYLTYFAGKVVGMIRAPDEFIYPPPFNIVEIFLIAPFEFFVSEKTYATINRYVMRVLFFIPLCAILLYESHLDPARNHWVKDWFSSADEGGSDAPHWRDPEVSGDDADRGLQISKVPFDELVAMFPDTTHSQEVAVMKEFNDLKAEIAELKQLIMDMAADKAKAQ